MKGKGLIITLIVLLSIIILMLIAILVLCINGTISFNGGFHFGSKKLETLIYEETYNLEEIKLINVAQKSGNIIFESTNDNKIKLEVYGENKNDVDVTMSNNELKVDYKAEIRGGWFFGLGRMVGEVKIYIPSSYAQNIKIKNEAGEVKIANIENATTDIDCNAGNIEIGKIKNLTLKCDAGNVKIQELLNKCNIKARAGNLKIEKANLSEDSAIKADLGNVTIKEINDIYIDAKVDFGNCKISKSNKSSNITLKIEANMGNVKVV